MVEGGNPKEPGWLRDFLVGGGIISVVLGWLFLWAKHMLGKPRITRIYPDKRNMRVAILEKDDVAWNDSSGEQGVKAHQIRAGDPPVLNYPFAVVVIENRPRRRWGVGKAIGVSAEITCVGRKTGRVVGPYFARPADTETTATRTDIPPSPPNSWFWLAFYVSGEGFYGFSRDSYGCYRSQDGTDKPYMDWKNPDLKMAGEDFDCHVVIRGENIPTQRRTYVLTQKGDAKNEG